MLREIKWQTFYPQYYGADSTIEFAPMLLLLVLAALLHAAPASAHVKWFVPLGEKHVTDFAAFSFTDTAVQVWTVIGLFLIAASVYLDRRLPALPPVEGRTRHLLVNILRTLTGLSLLLSAWSGSLIAPHYHWPGNDAGALLILEAVIGLMLMWRPTVFAAAILLLVLYGGVAAHYGPMEVLEYLNIAAVACYLGMLYFPDATRRKRYEPNALPVLRILTGIALVTLGFSEKLLRPDYAQTFIDTYMWNFMEKMGVESYTDRLFVLSAGTMEVVFGIILILGTTTRLNILVVSAFMFTSNITFFVEGNIEEALAEIIGHMPIIAIAIICVFFGAGQKLKITSLFSKPYRMQYVGKPQKYDTKTSQQGF